MDYDQPHILLPFLSRFVAEKSPYPRVSVEMVRDGSLRFIIDSERGIMKMVWSEKDRPAEVKHLFSAGVIWMEQPDRPLNAADGVRLRKAAEHVGRRLSRLLVGDPPHLLLWRNRNPMVLYWGRRMFTSLGSDLLVAGHTRYFDYTVAEINEYEGFVNIELRSRRASIMLRLTLTGLLDQVPLISWGPVSLVLLNDERTSEQRMSPEHQVEEYLGYVLSRNLPPDFKLMFERSDTPAGYLSEDFGVDLLRVRPLDDSSFFEMLLATSSDVGIVTSCSRECFNLFSFISSSKESWITNAPWQIRPSPDYLRHCYNVNMDTSATVMGSDSIERCLELLDETESPPGLIIFIDSCLHRLLGEDVSAHIRRFKKKSRIPVIHYDIRTTQHPYLKQLKDFWRNVLLDVAQECAPVPDRLCFLGLSPDATEEMEPLLAALGIETGAKLFPFLSLREVERIRSCSLVVASNWDYVKTIFSDMLDELGRPFIELPLPYGFDGTTRWIDAVLKAARGQGMEHDALHCSQESLDRFIHLRQALEGAGVGLFLRLGDLPNMLSPVARYGVDLIPFFHELGLGVHLNLLVDGEERDVAGLAKELNLDLSKADSVSLFFDPKELVDRISIGEFQMVYTETFRDQRIVAAGKAPLHLNQLYPGYLGAVRTATKIRGLLESGFYTIYRRFFTSPYEHFHERRGG